MANANQKKLIEDEKVKYITFSKRRSGIFKKASELCTLCAVEMAIIIFSPAGKPYSFGNHSLNATIDRFTHSANSDARATGEDGPPQQRVVLGDLYKQHSDLLAHLNAEKKRGKSLQKMASFPDIDKMNGDELLDLKSSMEDLKQKVLNRKKELLAKRPLDLTLTLGGIYSSGDVSSPTKYQPTWLDSSISVHNGDDSY